MEHFNTYSIENLACPAMGSRAQHLQLDNGDEPRPRGSDSNIMCSVQFEQ